MTTVSVDFGEEDDERAPNISQMHITMNSNKRVPNHDMLRVKNGFKALLKRLLVEDVQSREEVFGNSQVIKSITMQKAGLGFEEGQKFHRFHIHLSLTIEHFVPRYAFSKLAKRLTHWLNVHDDILYQASWYVHISGPKYLQDNYASKEARWKHNDMMENNPVTKEELDRLSADFTKLMPYKKTYYDPHLKKNVTVNARKLVKDM
jgi:hypothetical protein